MWLAVFLILMLSFWLFVRLAQRRPLRVEPLSRESMRAGFQPKASLEWWAWGGGAIAALAAALGFAAHPLGPPFTGRWGLLRQALHAGFGDSHMAWVFGAVALGFAAAALHAFQSRKRA